MDTYEGELMTTDIRLATIRVYLFGRALRVLARDAAAELQARGIERDDRIPVLDQLAAVTTSEKDPS